MTSPDTTRLDTTITNALDAYLGYLLTVREKRSAARAVRDALLAEGQIQHQSSLDEFWIIEDKAPDKRLSWRVLVIPLGGSS